ncbi:MAG: hypothetical protein EA401_00430 [Planctomycetota bacterium]|nr:MAG: hypothetical protein EA401_00430 [Planctomycetota bacterium]
MRASARGRQILHLLLSDGESDLQRRLLTNPPQALELVSFRGSDGRMLLIHGEIRPTAYRGQLLRFIGEGWEGEWRIVELLAP